MVEALLELVLGNLSSFALKELATFLGVDREIEKLSHRLTLIKVVLEDAEERQITNSSIRVWLQQLKDAVYVLDDILDECSIESLRHGDRGESSGSENQLHSVSLSSFKPKKIWFRYQVGKRLKEISERFDQIAEDRKKLLLREHEGIIERPIEVAEWRQTSSIIDQPQVHGRDEDKEKIVEFLVRQTNDCDALSICPIVGIGGVGKTTLTKLVFNDQRVSGHFNLKIWVCVSEDFTVKRILRSIIESIIRKEYSTLDLDPMLKQVQDLLQSKRYLLVLDDVWNENQDKWDQLKSVLACGSNGASVLVTTRNTTVASIMGTHPAYHLSGLSEDDCWSLFRQRAFGLEREEREELVAIGKEIVKKCGGLPLAAKALGSLMRSKSEERQWLLVKDSKLWDLPDEKSILPALRLSYFSLTPTLRRCFAFCAIFRKDEEIMKEHLIHLWMANGFISSRGNFDVEDVGNEAWNELYHKSFFQDVKTSYYGDISFKMHDLVHDLAQSVMGKECLVLENAGMADMSRSTHHIGYSGSGLSFNKGDFKKVESLRTLLQFESYYTRVSGWIPKNRSLRVLTANSLQVSSLSYLIHLRYLELYDLDAFPKSICSLGKLEILKLKNCYYLDNLPEDLTRLQNLRHLVISGYFSLSRMPTNIGKLSCLRTLSVFIVGFETGHSLAELGDLKLGGKLSIKGLKNVGSVSEAKGANLIGKKDLQQLSLSWGNSDETESYSADAGQVIEALQPHSNLKSLGLYQYEGSHLPSWMRDSSVLSSLVFLELSHFKNCLQLPPLGKLPSLKKLKIKNMQYVQYMDDQESYDGVEVRAFISLETLTLYEMPNLERLLKKEEGEMFPRLSEMFISNCPKLRLSCLPSLEHLNICECEEELLASVSSFCGLKSLEISVISKLKELPTQLMSLHTLERLDIIKCDELESFPEQVLEGLCSLRTLHIGGCKGLMSLPEGVRCLTSLEVLKISFCPILRERCKKGTGKDWPKIAHIPKVVLYP